MRFAFFGDVVGRSGREGLADHLPGLRRRLGLEFVIVNAENAAAGFGITESTARELFEAGADALTLGNHSWDQKEALTYIVREPRLIRPLNYSAFSDAPGRGAQLFETGSGRQILVINLLGRVHMDSLDDPFAAVDKELEACPLGAVADSVIGNQKEEPLRRFTTRISGGRFKPAEGPATVCGVYVETNDATGLARRVEPIRIGGRLSETVPTVEAATAA